MKVYDDLVDALGIVGFRDAGESVDPDGAQLAVRCFNRMVLEWSAKSIYNPTQTNLAFVSAGNDSITLGPTGDLATNPIEISQVTIEMGPSVFPCILKTLEEYERVFNKQTPGISYFAYWDRQRPLSTMHFWPKPMAGTTIRIVGFEKIATITDIQDETSLDEIYSPAIVNGVALRLWPHMPPGQEAIQSKADVLAQYHTALSGIKRLNNNMRSVKLVSDLVPSQASSYWTWAGRTV